MTVSLKHNFHSLKGDGTDPTKVQPSNWNEEHDLTMATAKVLGRITASAGPVEEIDWTAYGRSVINAADAAALKALIGFTEADIPFSAASRVVGRVTSGAGGGEELTLTQVLDMVGSAADGDMLVRSSGAWVRIPKGTLGQTLVQGAAVAAWGASPMLHVRETTGTGVNGPALSSGSTKRVINTSVLNEVTGASLGSGQITLPAGTYELDAQSEFISTITGVTHRLQLYNVTAGAEILVGPNSYAASFVTGIGVSGSGAVTSVSSNGQMLSSSVRGKFALGVSSVLELRSVTNGAGSGGSAQSGLATNIFSDVVLKKVG